MQQALKKQREEDRSLLNDVRPMTGDEYLESLRDAREIYVHGERVKDVTTHPAFRNTARMVARMYNALHDPATKDILTSPTDTGNGGFTHSFFRVARSAQDVAKDRDAIAHWARISYGWMGRSPDYKAAFSGTLGANNEFYKPYQANALAWYKKAQERVLFLNHAIVNPPIDRSAPPESVRDVAVRAIKETDKGVIVSGAKVVETNSALTNANFIGFYGTTPLNSPDMAIFAMIPMDSPGVKMICRPSYELAGAVVGSPFDYPLSSRMDENDAILVLDDVLIPWEDLFIYRDIEAANAFYALSGFTHRFAQQACTRFAVKLDFLAGLLLKAVEMTGTKDFRGVQAHVGEVLAWRNLFWSITDSQVSNVSPWLNGAVLPNLDAAGAYRVLAPTCYPRIKEIFQQAIGSGLIYLPSHVKDLGNPDLRPVIDRFIRGSGGASAEDRIKLLKLTWDAIGSEFGGRHELYERNYAGNHENIRLENVLMANATGVTDRAKAFVDQCLAEYDVNGWTAPDLINPTDVAFDIRKATSA
jgi:4-hydroxyphenylacetate 3-monooxygenase